MLTLLAIVHVIVAISLIILVLLQDPKGGAAGIFGGGGGGSQSLFGSTGATSFLNKATKWMAIFFAATSISIVMTLNRASDSVLDRAPLTPPATGIGGGLGPEPDEVLPEGLFTDDEQGTESE